MNPGIDYYQTGGQQAAGLVTVRKVPAAGATVTIGGTVFTFETDFFGKTAVEVAVGLTGAINGDRATYNKMHKAAVPVRPFYAVYYGESVAVVATSPGPNGNSITLAVSDTVAFQLSGGTLTGGAGAAQAVTVSQTVVQSALGVVDKAGLPVGTPEPVAAADLWVSSFAVYPYKTTSVNGPPVPNSGTLYVAVGAGQPVTQFLLPTDGPAVFDAAAGTKINLRNVQLLTLTGGDGAVVEYQAA